MIVISFLFLGLSLIQQSVSLECNSTDEVPCSVDGECIHYTEWCDGNADCHDGSDETHCSGATCLDNQFTCQNGKCIPNSAECNGIDNCGDASDEHCESIGMQASTSNKEVLYLYNKQAIIAAAKYLLKMRKSDYGWDDFTPRAIIALTFAEKFIEIPERDKELMWKRLDVEILLNLKRNGREQSLADLSLFINALYATCQDPRNFHGMDLVGILRSETSAINESVFSLPSVLMTLCLARETQQRDLKMFYSMYDKRSNDIIGFKALTMIAMASCKMQGTFQRSANTFFQSRIQGLHSSIMQNMDVYSRALLHQAMYAVGYNMWNLRPDLLSHQLPDGSFGDLLATYSAIPVLLNTSLLDLKCKRRTYDENRTGMLLSNGGVKKEIRYSLWITENNDMVSHSQLLTIEGKKSLYDAMKLAEFRDPMYRFKYDETKLGKKVYSLGGIPNDAETGMLWNLYRGYGQETVNSTKYLQMETYGVDKIFPESGNHFVFWLERGKV